jgi:putative transposase
MIPLVDKIIDDILEEYYLTKQKTGFTKIYRNIKKECMNQKLTPPHANSIRNRIKSIDPKLAMKKR